MALYWGGTRGGSQHVDLGSVTAGDTADMSICAWVRLPNTFSDDASILDRRSTTLASERFWFLALGNGAGKADFRFVRKHATTNAKAITTAAYDTDNDTWLFLGATHSAGNATRIYVGTQTTAVAEASYAVQVSPVGALQTGAQPMSIGRLPFNAGTGFGGAIAVVGMFDTELTGAELEALRLGGMGAILARPDLVHFWGTHLNGTTGTVYDIGPRSIIAATNVNGTISGTLTQVENPGLLRGFPAVGPADWRPVASATANTDVSFDTLAYTQTLPDVSVAVDTPVALDALSYTATLPDLTVSVDTPVALDAISYTQILPDISVAVSAVISLDTISYTLSLPDVSVQVDTPVSVDTISYSATLPDIGVAVDTPVNLDALNYAVTLPDITVQTSVTVDLDVIGYTSSLSDLSVSVRSGARGDDAFRSNGARERFWRRKAEEWLEDHLEQTLRATTRKKSARKRAATRIVAAASAAAVEMPEIAPRIDLIARFAAQLSAPDPDLIAIATAVAAQLEQVETERRTRRRKRDLEAVLLLAA